MTKIIYTGIADEAGAEIDVQIKATRELGWQYLETRKIGSSELSALSDEEFENCARKLSATGIKISCYSSDIANWGKDPFKEDDFSAGKNALIKSFPRLRKLGAACIRGMSFAMQKNLKPDDAELEKITIKKVGELAELCGDNGIIYMHENCMNWGGQSWEHSLKLAEKIKSPFFKLLFDTGNPVMTDDRRGKTPYKKQSSWEFYYNIRDFIAYIHIKDGIFLEESEGVFPKAKYTFPGEGHGDVKKILADLISRGYEGFVSIEPHMSKVFHESGSEFSADLQYKGYIEYGKKLMHLINELKKS